MIYKGALGLSLFWKYKNVKKSPKNGPSDPKMGSCAELTGLYPKMSQDPPILSISPNYRLLSAKIAVFAKNLPLPISDKKFTEFRSFHPIWPKLGMEHPYGPLQNRYAGIIIIIIIIIFFFFEAQKLKNDHICHFSSFFLLSCGLVKSEKIKISKIPAERFWTGT